MTREQRQLANLVPALWYTADGTWHWDVMDVSSGNIVGNYNQWSEC